MKDLLAFSILSQHSFRILHWNVSTSDFDPVHELMGSYVDKMGEFIDLFAEIDLMLGEKPIGLNEISSILEDANIDPKAPEPKRDYTPSEVFTVTSYILQQLLKLVREKLERMSSQLPRGIQSELEVVDFWLTKELHYKNRQRLNGN